MVIALLGVLSALAGQGGAANAAEQPVSTNPEAEAQYRVGIQRANAKDYDGAIRALQAAYAIDPRREILFAWAQAERLSGDCDDAIPLYRRFLDSDPPARQVEAARFHLERCEQVVAARPAPKPIVHEVRVPVAVPGAPPQPPSRFDWITGALLVGAVAAAGGGGVMLAAARSDVASAKVATTLDDYLAHADRVQSRQRIAVGLFAAGGALAVTAAVRALFIRRASRERPSLSFGPGQIAWRAAF
jgi:tetratricopeptide (TPR) repeat protein